MARLPSDIFSSLRERSWGPQAIRLNSLGPMADLSIEETFEILREVLEQIPAIVEGAIEAGAFARREEVEQEFERALQDALGVSGARPVGGLPLLLDDVRELAAYKREVEARDSLPEDEEGSGDG
ncbi:MAG TPA: hypothetical protein VKU41_18790 [Polyangiaceae bacterium]|nr:hypothetical protein [Polyangiaceae bacterium]